MEPGPVPGLGFRGPGMEPGLGPVIELSPVPEMGPREECKGI